jgi:hypothetical protein
LLRNAPVYQDGAAAPNGDCVHPNLWKSNVKLESSVTALDNKIGSIVEILQQQQLEMKVICLG